MGGGCDNVRWNFHTWSILHVFQGAQGMLWGGLGGGGDVITSVGTFRHGGYYMFSRVRRACCGVGWVGRRGGDVITSVGTFTHGRYYMFFMFFRARRACCGVGWVGGRGGDVITSVGTFTHG